MKKNGFFNLRKFLNKLRMKFNLQKFLKLFDKKERFRALVEEELSFTLSLTGYYDNSQQLFFCSLLVNQDTFCAEAYLTFHLESHNFFYDVKSIVVTCDFPAIDEYSITNIGDFKTCLIIPDTNYRSVLMPNYSF